MKTSKKLSTWKCPLGSADTAVSPGDGRPGLSRISIETPPTSPESDIDTISVAQRPVVAPPLPRTIVVTGPVKVTGCGPLPSS